MQKPNMAPSRNAMPTQDANLRARNFSEVALGYDEKTAMDKAMRCLNCKNMPCVSGCPVKIHIPEFISKIKEGDFEGAYQVITKSSSLPAVCGRVCPQETQCESQCVRGIKGESVGIGRLERFVADWHNTYCKEEPARPKSNGHKVAIVGSGAGLPNFMGILGESLNGVYSANEFLTRSNLMKAYMEDSATPIMKGAKVAVVGGGNVAMDAARTALRLGADKVYIVYRRSIEELPARREEVEHAEEEGVEFKLLCSPVEILGYKNENDPRDAKNGFVTGMNVIKMQLGEPDERGKRRPVEIAGSEFTIDVDTVIMSIGTSPNPLIKSTTDGLEVNKKGGIIVNEDGLTSREAVYAGGDAVTGAATVISAMGAGKTAAKAIDEYLSFRA
ncbi:MAG: FAD-dependent oxidoreductase [Clostridia bacterium]|nr:FAD-dependent oxidoreductase [Clostridia bacterium]